MLNSFTPLSAVSARTASVLEAFHCLSPIAGREYEPRGVVIGGERLPDLVVRVSRAATMLDVERMLGLNFLNQFLRIGYDAADRVLSLET